MLGPSDREGIVRDLANNPYTSVVWLRAFENSGPIIHGNSYTAPLFFAQRSRPAVWRSGPGFDAIQENSDQASLTGVVDRLGEGLPFNR
jgi:hypothetical protein